MQTEITEKDVKRMVRKCMQHLKLKRYELHIQKSDVENAVNITRVGNTKGASAGKEEIYIGLKPWQAERFYVGKIAQPNPDFTFTEYDAYNRDKVIGQIDCKTFENMMFLIVAHEVSHHVQYHIAPHIKRYRSTYEKAHGDAFKDIYRMLRRGLINPTIADT